MSLRDDYNSINIHGWGKYNYVCLLRDKLLFESFALSWKIPCAYTLGEYQNGKFNLIDNEECDDYMIFLNIQNLSHIF